MSDQGNNGGILSKFQERLRKIRLSRSKKRLKNQKFIEDKVKEIRNTIREESYGVYKKINNRGNVANKNEMIKKNSKESINVKFENKKDENLKKDCSINEVIDEIRATSNERNYGRRKFGIGEEESTFKENNTKDSVRNNIIVNESNKKVNYLKKSRNIAGIEKEKINNITDLEREELVNRLGSEIIDKIKEGFEDKLDELEVLTSELFFLKEEQDRELMLKRVKEIKERINNLISHVNKVIAQYNLYNKNYYIENVVGIDDSVLIDDIINYRNLLDSNNSEKKFVKEYKALEEFKRLYSSLQAVKNDTEKLIEENEQKILKYNINNKKYDNIKLEIVNVEEIDKKCFYEIEKQNEYFKELMSKVNYINKEEYVTRHLRGLGDLIAGSLRYMGLIALSPLRGLIPGIAMQAIATKRLIGNIYRNLHYEEVKHIHYETINYDSELNHHLSDVFYTEKLLDSTYRDIEKLKEDFMMQYDSKIPGYEDTLKNILNIEKKVIHNQNKIDIIKKNLKKSKKLNEDKIILVKKMNDAQK